MTINYQCTIKQSNMIYIATFFIIVGLLLREICYNVNLVYYLIKVTYFFQFRQAVKKAESLYARPLQKDLRE